MFAHSAGLWANVKKDELFYCNTIHAIKSAIEHIYFSLGFEEMIRCPACNESQQHMYYLSHLFEKWDNGETAVACPHAPVSSFSRINIHGLAPDLTLPRVPTYKKNFKILEKLGALNEIVQIYLL